MVVGFLTAALSTSAVLAKDDPQVRQKALQSEIAAVLKDIAKEKNRYTDLERKLSDVEKRIQAHAIKLRGLDAEVQVSSRRLADLQKKKASQSEALNEQQRLLAKQLRAAWVAGNQERLQLWLSGGDVKMFGPMLTWYDYINRRRVENVVDISNEIEVLAQLEQQLADADKQLRQLRGKEAKNAALLAEARKSRKALLSSSQAKIKAESDQLKALREEDARLKSLIERLKAAAAQAPPAAKPSTPFAKLVGKLRWPVKGKVLTDYGEPRADGRLKWNGVTLSAKRGAKVTAVADGEVIYADWLGRLGLLMIVDHGDNYLTLYGHNEALYKKPGDRVLAGELLSSVGDSGGRQGTALYFEVRKGSEFRNPHLWCKKPPR